MGKGLTDLFIEQVMWFPGVRETESEAFNERSFRIEGRVFLRVHGNSRLHLLLSRKTKALAIARGLARQNPFAPRSGAVELSLRTEDQLGAALGLARQAYDYTRGRIQRAAPAQCARCSGNKPLASRVSPLTGAAPATGGEDEQQSERQWHRPPASA
jgi:hypothetical protein